MAQILDGKAVSLAIKEKIKKEVLELKKNGITPGLAVVLAGNDPASARYVKHKRLDCEECGIESFYYNLPAETSADEILTLINQLNENKSVHGILVQMPLPNGQDEQRVLRAISPAKDADAFHPENVGLISIGTPRFLPCTPAGVMELLDYYGIDPAGKECVVVGRSNIVGKPMAMLLLARHGTVTVCHSRTERFEEHVKRADILVLAAGKAGLVTGDMVKPGAAVIDVAMNVKQNGKLTGDAVFDEVKEVAGYLTPVPGGVGPMTRVMLLQNTIKAARA